MAKPDRQKFTAGVVLVLFGLGFYLVQRLDAIGNSMIMLIIGAAFLVAYFYQKAYGLLIPAGILLGLGFGTLLQGQYWWANDGTQLGLGVGFLSIYVIAKLYERETHWWPLIPGVILILVGLPKTAKIFRYLFDNWPLILVAIGLLILIGAFRRSTADEPQQPPAAPMDGGEPAVPVPPAEPEEPVPPAEPEEPVEPIVE